MGLKVSVCLVPLRPGLINVPFAISPGLSLLLVLNLLDGIFSGFSSFPPSTKTNKFEFDLYCNRSVVTQ